MADLTLSGPRPECPKGAKDEVKRPEGPPARSQGPEGPLDFQSDYFVLRCLQSTLLGGEQNLPNYL